MSSDIVQVDSDISESELLDELAAEALQEPKPGYITVRMLMERIGKETGDESESAARRILRQKVKSGKMYEEWAKVDSHPVKVYYRKT